MSTKATIIYASNRGIHIYREMSTDMVHLEIDTPFINLNVEIMSSAEWYDSVDKFSLRRQTPKRPQKPFS